MAGEEAYPDAPVVRLVLDNLNTHRKASLYEAFSPSEARRIAKRLEFTHTPKHENWPNPVHSLPNGWRRSRPGPACGDATPIWTALKGLPTPACQSATLRPPASTGGSLPRTPGPNSTASTLFSPDFTQCQLKLGVACIAKVGLCRAKPPFVEAFEYAMISCSA